MRRKKKVYTKHHSHRRVLLAARGDKQHAGGPGTAGVRVGIPGLGITVVQEHQVQFSLVHRQLEEQRRAHAAGRRLEVPLSSDTVHGCLTANGSTKGPTITEHLQCKHEIIRAAEERSITMSGPSIQLYSSIKYDTNKQTSLPSTYYHCFFLFHMIVFCKCINSRFDYFVNGYFTVTKDDVFL